MLMVQIRKMYKKRGTDGSPVARTLATCLHTSTAFPSLTPPSVSSFRRPKSLITKLKVVQREHKTGNTKMKAIQQTLKLLQGMNL